MVGLPIGNIEDISARAIRTLSESDLIVCEDTRMFNNLWQKLISLNLATPLLAKVIYANEFNEHGVISKLSSDFDKYESISLVSDAGMPLISDPGFLLVREALRSGVEVGVVPGPTAESAALSVSGLPTDKVFFAGFLHKKPGKRLNQLKSYREMAEVSSFSLVIYESPIRLRNLLQDAIEVVGDKDCFLGIDLTKISEKKFRGKISEVMSAIGETPIKGELVLVISLIY